MAIVTISRQVGSWGDEVAGLAAGQLGYELIGHEAVQAEAEACDAAYKQACSAFVEETKPDHFWDRLMFSDPGYTALFEQMNFELAAKGEVVMVGRGAHLALAGVPGVLKVRITAPFSLRVDRVAKEKDIDREQAEHYVDNFGRRRRALLESIYHELAVDASQFDLVINTSQLSTATAADLISEAARQVGAGVDKQARKNTLIAQAKAKVVERLAAKEITTQTYQGITAQVVDGKLVVEGLVSDEINRDRLAKLIADNWDGPVDNQVKVLPLFY